MQSAFVPYVRGRVVVKKHPVVKILLVSSIRLPPPQGAYPTEKDAISLAFDYTPPSAKRIKLG